MYFILMLSAILACFSQWPVHFLGHSRITDFDPSRYETHFVLRFRTGALTGDDSIHA